ncbi:MAG: cytochrome c biogenesis heme-transporting ATPase CcmA [Gammaproteobacteria bacterium]|nr:cytochrome c biogenesis heme-transporting ATPase CcmA [Gammaproteobacteria bacterium]
MLSARQLFCERDDRVLFDSLDFDLAEGEVLQVQGGNGSGKTTLLRIICGLHDSFEGAISWYGDPIEKQRELFYSSLLYMGHRVGVNKILSPLENLRWSCSMHGSTTPTQIESALAQLGLRGYENSPCHMLSAGQQQRVSLARLLISPAKLWVLDEPFTTLDAHGVKDLENLLANHVDNGGSVLVTTHHKLNVSSGIHYLKLDDVGHD